MAKLLKKRPATLKLEHPHYRIVNAAMAAFEETEKLSPTTKIKRC